MRYQIPDDNQERLELLNIWFTQILCSNNYFDDDKWLAIRLNLLKWSQFGFSFRQLNVLEKDDFTVDESALVYKIYNSLSEIDLFSYATKESAKIQKFEQAAHYRDLGKLCREGLKELHELNGLIIPFFKIDDEALVLKHIENYFIKQYIKERIRK